jgi:hypothetical protein
MLLLCLNSGLEGLKKLPQLGIMEIVFMILIKEGMITLSDVQSCTYSRKMPHDASKPLQQPVTCNQFSPL